MEQVNQISAVEPEKVSLDAVEIAGLIVPLLFAIMAIVLVALAPDSAEAPSKDSKTESQRVELIEQIQRR
ncbi:hypothetical protein [Marinobacter sp. HL-58]|uniref:hypothetical protein n=1 Tax=Marinobacter sp. HL-58 TaxID=1479237 RepID=UPI000481E3F7|nr:hypothetical protein [Marinobacter sp. HL-58]KPQ01593.1 MAG: hypothetical protein HLUCCO03_12045 [Marinobacter sp. HL-58]